LEPLCYVLGVTNWNVVGVWSTFLYIFTLH
jgi:hypothetical protein